MVSYHGFTKYDVRENRMSDGSNWNYGNTEHHVVQNLPGDLEHVRARLAATLESFGYEIIAEDPMLKARREAQGWAAAGGSANALEYPVTLTIWFKSDREDMTRVTFDYEIKHPMLGRADKELFSREARALSAVANNRARSTLCAGCGTATTDDSRFCRRCGVPITVDLAEVEMLRVASESRSAQSILHGATGVLFAGLVILLIGIILFLTKENFSPKAMTALMMVGSAMGFASFLTMLFAGNRLRRALKSSEPQKTAITEPKPLALPSRHTMRTSSTGPLHVPEEIPAPISVTEGTTQLIEEEPASDSRPRDVRTRA
jgi:hypothetical protein